MPRLLADSRIVALIRAACAERRALRLVFLRGYWRDADLRRVATAAAALGVEIGDIAPGQEAAARDLIAARLAALLQAAHPVGDGLNSLAEHLGGRAPQRPDRLLALRFRDVDTQADPPAEN